MENYQLVSDATLDLPAGLADELDVLVVPMHFYLGGKSYAHYIDERELSNEAFYQELRTGADASTTQINPSVYEETFTPLLKAGLDILYITFSSGLSGTINNARMAAAQLEETYPGRRVVVIDSLCASIGEGLLVYHAAKKKQEGLSLDQLAAWVEEHKSKVAHWFTVDDLNHLRRGGRISAVEAVVGTALNIKPILTVDDEGRLAVAAKVRGSRKALQYVADRLAEEKSGREQTVLIGHADNLADAQALAELVREHKLAKEIIITKIGPIIGSHTGAGMTALTFMNT